jgi:hypothetical protein
LEFATNLLRLGYTHTLVVGETANDMDYCSKWFYPTPDGYLLGGKIGRVLSRAGWFLDVQGEQTIFSAALSQLHDNYHVPFLRQYFSKVVTLCKQQKLVNRGKPREAAIHMSERHDYDQSTWDFITSKYGLTPQDLVEFERILSHVTVLPVAIDWPLLGKCLEVDGA